MSSTNTNRNIWPTGRNGPRAHVSNQVQQCEPYMAGGPLKPGFEWAATAPFGQILAKYNEGGVQTALDKVRQILATSGQHAAMMLCWLTGLEV
jgi:hypothetical protein